MGLAIAAVGAIILGLTMGIPEDNSLAYFASIAGAILVYTGGLLSGKAIYGGGG